MRKLIKVEQKHIDDGRRLDCRACPVALALADAGYYNSYAAFVYCNVNGKHYINPRSVRRFMNAFDLKRPVKPFNFYLDSNR